MLTSLDIDHFARLLLRKNGEQAVLRVTSLIDAYQQAGDHGCVTTWSPIRHRMMELERAQTESGTLQMDAAIPRRAPARVRRGR